MQIHQQKADLSIRQPKAEMTIRRIPGKLDIDQSEAFAEEHLKSIKQLIADYAKRGRQAVMKGIARRVEDGNRFMRIEDGGHPIAELARLHSSDPPLRFNIGWMPKSAFSVKIHYHPGKLMIHWKTHSPQIHVKTHSPDIGYVPGNVNVYMRQRPSLDIRVVGLHYDQNI